MHLKGYNSVTSWVAAFACSIIGFLLTIPMRIAGLLFVIIIDRYETDRFHATIPIILFGMIRALTGPFTGYLGQVFGLRTITLLGSILASVGVGGCFFAENILTVIICLGIIFGTGFGFGYTLMPTILNQHFNKDLNLANSTYLSASCLGAVITPKIVEFFIREYGYSAMFLLLSGIILNSVPFSILLKDPKNEEYHLKEENQNDVYSQAHDNLCYATAPGEKSHKSFVIGNSICTSKNTSSKFNETLQISHRPDVKKGNINLSFVAEEMKQVLCLNYKVIDQENIVTKYSNKEINEHGYNSNELKTFNNVSFTNEMVCEKGNTLEEKQSLNHKLLYDKGNCQLAISTKTDNTEKESSKIPVFKLFFLFRDPTFLVQMTIQSLQAFITTVIWTIIMDFARDKEISPAKSLYIVMYLPLAEMFGNISLSWIIDWGYMSRTNFCMAGFLIMGTDCLYMIYASSYVAIMVTALLFGFVSGSINSTFPGVINEFIEEDQKAMALSSRYFLYAFLCLCKTLMIGYFRGTLGSYNGVLYILTACCVLSCLLMMLTPILANLRESKKQEKNDI